MSCVSSLGSGVSWADAAIAQLLDGQAAIVRPKGHSMTPRVRNGEIVTLAPIGDQPVEKGEVVLVKVKGIVYLHLVHAVGPDQVLIGNNHGRTNGWTSKSSVYGRMVSTRAREAPVTRQSKAKGRDMTDPFSHGSVAKGGPITRIRVSPTRPDR